MKSANLTGKFGFFHMVRANAAKRSLECGSILEFEKNSNAKFNPPQQQLSPNAATLNGIRHARGYGSD